MKFFRISLAATMLLTTVGLQAQTAEEVMSKHIAAVGGDAWKKVNSLKKTQTMMVGGMEVTIIETQVRGKGVRSELSMGGNSGGYEIATPTKGWKLDLMGGDGKLTEMSAEEVKANKEHIEPRSDYADYKDRGMKVELAGKEDLNGRPCYKMKITGADGITRTVRFDAATYYKMSVSEIVPTANGPMDVTTTYSDHKKFAEGIVLPMRAKNDYQEIITKEVEINKTIADSVFQPTN